MTEQLIPKNISTLLSTAVSITTQATVFSYKPFEEATPNGAYLYVDCENTVSDYANKGELTRVCRATIYVVGPKEHATKLDEMVVDEIVDALNNFLIDNNCNMIRKIDDVNVSSIAYRFTSPMGYTEKNRPIRSVSYDIKYKATQ